MSALAYHGARSFESRPAEVWEAADEGWVLIASRGDRPDPSWLKEK